MTKRALWIAVVLLLGSLTQGLAAGSLEEIRRQEGLFILQDFTQWAQMRYQFEDSKADTSTTSNYYSTHELKESYNASLSGAIRDPRVFSFTLLGELSFQQLWSSNSTAGSSETTGFDYQYNFNGIAYDRSWHPVTISSSRQSNTVTTPYIPSYDYVTTSNAIEVAILKNPDARLRYERSTQDASGGTFFTNTSIDALTLSSSYNYRNFSNTTIVGSWSNSRSTSSNQTITDSKIGLDAGNNTVWGRTGNYSLATRVKWDDESYGGVPQKELTYSELFAAQLGRALDATASYAYSYDSITNFSGQEQVLISNTAFATLRHRLFESLTTELRGDASSSELLGGTQDIYSVKAGFWYTKRLPADSQLGLGGYWKYGVTDQKLTSSDFTVRNEQHTVSQQGEYITLGTVGVLTAVISVMSRNPDITYAEGPDYTVDKFNRQIQVVTGGRIAPGTVLYISYIIHYDPSVRYSTVDLSANARVSLFNGRFLFTGLYFEESPTILSGQGQFILANRASLARFQGLEGEHTYYAEYGSNEAGPSSNWHVGGGWQFLHEFPSSRLNLSLTDTYTVYSPGGLSSGYSQNLVTWGGTYTTVFPTGVLCVVNSSVTDSRGGLTEGDVISLGLTLRKNFNLLAVSLLGQSGWRLTGDTTLRNDYIRLEVTRYF